MYPRGAIPLVFSQRQTLPLSLPCANLFSPSCHDTGSLAIRDRDTQPRTQDGASAELGRFGLKLFDRSAPCLPYASLCFLRPFF